MLNNPQWQKTLETARAVEFSREHVIAWLETQPADGAYCYTDTGECLIAKYLTFLGHTRVSVGALGCYNSDRISRTQAPRFLYEAAVQSPRTFGAALDRVRAWTGGEDKFAWAYSRAPQ